jgi:hypothetical protein
MNFTAETATINYFYLPIAGYNGRVLKCGGIATDDNREWFKELHPGTVVLQGYRGDRIRASDHSLFGG